MTAGRMCFLFRDWLQCVRKRNDWATVGITRSFLAPDSGKVSQRLGFAHYTSNPTQVRVTSTLQEKPV